MAKDREHYLGIKVAKVVHDSRGHAHAPMFAMGLMEGHDKHSPHYRTRSTELLRDRTALIDSALPTNMTQRGAHRIELLLIVCGLVPGAFSLHASRQALHHSVRLACGLSPLAYMR